MNNGAKNTKTTYTYNEDGIRIMKNFEGIKTRYLLDGTNIIAQEVTNGDSFDYIYFFYDASGSPVGMNYLGYNYYYKKNLQGDIIEIWGTEDGTDNHTFRCLVKYVYDAWGNILQMNDTTDGWYRVGTANPFRYRGYYYDNESGFYYLQSRYYDPVTGRFLNADDTAYIGATDTASGYNLFSYCENDCVNKIDPDGKVSAKRIAEFIVNVIIFLLGSPIKYIFIGMVLDVFTFWGKIKLVASIVRAVIAVHAIIKALCDYYSAKCFLQKLSAYVNLFAGMISLIASFTVFLSIQVGKMIVKLYRVLNSILFIISDLFDIAIKPVKIKNALWAEYC